MISVNGTNFEEFSSQNPPCKKRIVWFLSKLFFMYWMYILLVVHLFKCNRAFFIIYILGSGRLAIVWYSFDKWWRQFIRIFKDCGEKFLSKAEYNSHTKTHLQTHIDIWASNSKQSKDTNDIPNGLMPHVLKMFEKYKLDGKRLICLLDSKNGQVNAAMADIARQHQLQERLKEWLVELG